LARFKDSYNFLFLLFEHFVFVAIPFSSPMRKYGFPPPAENSVRLEQLMALGLEKWKKSFLPGQVTVYHAVFKSFSLGFTHFY